MIRVYKWWTQENWTSWKSGNGWRNVTSAQDDRQLIYNAVRLRILATLIGYVDRLCWLKQLTERWPLLQVCHCLLQQFSSICCTVSCMQEFLCIGFPSRKTIGTCGHNVLFDIDTGMPIGSKFPFPMNPVLIWIREMAVSTLDAIPLNNPLRDALPYVILKEYPVSSFEAPFGTMGDLIR